MNAKKISALFTGLFLLILTVSPVLSASSSQAPLPESVPFSQANPYRLLAALKPGVTPGQVISQKLGIVQAKHLFSGQDLPASLAQIVMLDLSPESDVSALAASLKKDTQFLWVEPDYLAYAANTADVNTIPNDTDYPQQWGLEKIAAPAAWDVQTGSPTVVIAIVDSGLDLDHPDLQGRLWVNPGEIASNGLDDDNNGLIDDVHGWNFVSEIANLSDLNGHGTQVAGVAAADTDNDLGIAGTCWGCRLMAVKVMSDGGVANYSDIAQGVVYAAQKGAKVINISLGGYSYSSTLLAAIQAAVNDYGAVVVAGAGNDDTDTPFYPAAYDEVIAVAGTDEDDLKASFSDYGTWVDLAAPAVAIHTTFSGGGYGAVDGTSVAAPFVSGTAGLLFSHYPEWPNDLVRAQLEHTADSLDVLNSGYEGLLGFGRVNAGSALSVAPHPIVEMVETKVNGDPLERPMPGESATLAITLGNDWLDAQDLTGVLTTSDAYVTITQNTADFGDLPAGDIATGSPAYTFDVLLEAGYDHPIDFTLAVSAYGGAYTTEFDFTIRTRLAEELVGGTIEENTTWMDNITYIVTSNIGVAPGITLTIEPGTTVEFYAGTNLNVSGQLIADGTITQPIRFISYDGSTWGKILFSDSSTDAVADLDGNYLSGNILRWVVMERGSIGCDYATPYVSQLTLDGGSLVCALGASPLWLMDSSLSVTGETNISYPGYATALGYYAHLLRVSIKNGMDVQLHSPSEVRDSNFSGGLFLYGDSTVDNCTLQPSKIAQGLISVLGAGMVTNNTAGSIYVGDGSVVQGNRIEGYADLGFWGIQSTGAVTISRNWLLGNAHGIQTYGGSVQGNLIANTPGVGLEIYGNVVVSNNTVTGIGDNAIVIVEGTPTIQGNNLEGNTGTYDIENQTANNIIADGNWWGTTDASAIALRIYDYYDGVTTLGKVNYSPAASGPIQTAPAYVRPVTLDPASPVGIETVTFEVEFSRPMDTSSVPELSFQSVLNESWGSELNTINSGLPSDYVNAIATDLDGSLWFGTLLGVAQFDGTNWTVYNTSNSGLPVDVVTAIAVDPDGSYWFGTDGGGVVHFHGSYWTVYNSANSQLPHDGVRDIAINSDGSLWFGTDLGLAHFDGVNWTVYNTSNSELPADGVTALATDTDGSVWIGTQMCWVANFDGVNWTTRCVNSSGGAVSDIATDQNGSQWFAGYGITYFDGTSWLFYDPQVYGYPELGYASAIAPDIDGSVWMGGDFGAARFDGIAFIIYTSYSSIFAEFPVDVITSDLNNSLWFGTRGGGVVAYLRQPIMAIRDNSGWLDNTRYQASFEFTSLIPRGDYRITVAGAVDSDGMEIVPNTATTFTVDYAGAVTDTSAPPAPNVSVCAGLAVGDISASWTASDPDSAITLYQYAIGTTPGGAEVINWTTTSATSFDLHGLSLTAGQIYYVSVKARNEGGLWSEAGTAPGVLAGSDRCLTNISAVYLPLLRR